MLPSPVGPAGSRAARAARAERSCHWRSEKFGVSGFSYVDVTFDLNLRTEPVVIFNCGQPVVCSKLTKTTIAEAHTQSQRSRAFPGGMGLRRDA